MQIQISNLSLKQNDFSFRIKGWQVPSGSHLLIEGASGCGKTSFLHLLAGFLSPSDGSILVGDNNITQLSKIELCQFRRSHLGMIFQKIHLLAHLTLLENILLGAQPDANKIVHGEALHLIDRLGLSHRLHHLPKELSVGETQRASVARALVADTGLVLADEPTASLDDKNAEVVFQLLKEKCKNKTLLIVSHDSRARKHFDQVINFTELLSS